MVSRLWNDIELRGKEEGTGQCWLLLIFHFYAVCSDARIVAVSRIVECVLVIILTYQLYPF